MTHNQNTAAGLWKDKTVRGLIILSAVTSLVVPVALTLASIVMDSIRGLSMQTTVLLEESFQAVLDIATFLSMAAVILVAIRSTFKAFLLCAVPIYLYSAWYNWTILSLSFDYSAGIPATREFYMMLGMALGMFLLPPLVWWGLTRLLGLLLKKEMLLFGAASLILVAAYKGVYFWLALREAEEAASLTGETVSVFSLALNNGIHGLLLFAVMIIFYTIYSSKKNLPNPTEQTDSILSKG